MSRFESYDRWPRYVPVAQRRQQATQTAQKLEKKGQKLRPIQIAGRTIASTFWGKAWCDHLESYADYSNRMPRGRSYARNGSILDLQIHPGKITSLVSGSSLYRIAITINKLPPKTWKAICADCAAEVSTLLELLSGKLPDSVLKRLTDRRDGLFPQPREIKIQCSCPDGARMCKHAAATLYGVGHLLDTKPELFFMMRGVDQSELVSEGWQVGQVAERMGLNADANASLANADLGSIFGIELAGSSEPIATRITVDVQRNKPAKTPRVPAVLSAPNKTAKSKSATSQAVKSETAKSKAVKSKAVKSRAVKG